MDEETMAREVKCFAHGHIINNRPIPGLVHFFNFISPVILVEGGVAKACLGLTLQPGLGNNISLRVALWQSSLKSVPEIKPKLSRP